MRTGKFIGAVCHCVINIQVMFLTFYDNFGRNLIIIISPFAQKLEK